MAQKAVAVSEEPREMVPFQDIYLMALPIETYRIISDEAARRGETFGAAIQKAIQLYMGSTDR